MRGEASADLALSSPALPYPFQSACAGKRRQTRLISETLQAASFSPHARGSVGRLLEICFTRWKRVSVRMRGEASADPPPRGGGLLFINPGFSPHARGSVGRQAAIKAAEVEKVSVRMRGEASADPVAALTIATEEFQSACAGKRRQTVTGGRVCYKTGFSPHARGSVGRPTPSPSRFPPCFSPHARGSVGRRAERGWRGELQVSVRMRGEASADPT